MAARAAAFPPDERIVATDLSIDTDAGPLALRTYRPRGVTGIVPCIYFIHGGGMIVGDLDSEDPTVRALCAALGCYAVSVEYRLAPEHPHPAQVEDCYAGLAWVVAHAAELGIDAGRIALYGGSAGGALAAATALMARDRRGPLIAFQMLIYPMLDDRGTTPSSVEVDDVGVFDGFDSRLSWEALLGERRGGEAVEATAAPARATDLRGLPPAWVEVGEIDALRDEAIEFAARLLTDGVPTELRVYPGAYHSSEVFAPDADLSGRMIANRVAALRRALDPDRPGQAAGATARERIDPSLRAPLDGFLAATGPRGPFGIEGIAERREQLAALLATRPRPDAQGVITEDRHVPSAQGAPDVLVRVYRPVVGAAAALPALLVFHGGGMVMGSVEADHAATLRLVQDVGCAAIAVEYRLAPEHPHPAALQDAYAALTWTYANAQMLGIDPARIGLYGASSGGGIAAATAVLARDRGAPSIALQMLLFPMLDDRAGAPSVREIDDIGVFDGWANTAGWDAALGDRRGRDDVRPFAAVARVADLAGLAPAYLDVGALDAVRDEVIAYAMRLAQAGVTTELHVVPGAFHAWTALAPAADASRTVIAERAAVLRRALALG